jgi:hypothetical protein
MDVKLIMYDYILVLQPETQIFKLIETVLHCQCCHTIQASSFICLNAGGFRVGRPGLFFSLIVVQLDGMIRSILSLFLYVISRVVVFTLVAFAC